MARRKKAFGLRVYDIVSNVLPWPASSDWVRMTEAQQDEHRHIRAFIAEGVRRGVRLGRRLEAAKRNSVNRSKA